MSGVNCRGGTRGRARVRHAPISVLPFPAALRAALPAQDQRADGRSMVASIRTTALAARRAPAPQAPHVPSDRSFASRRPSPTRSSPRAVSLIRALLPRPVKPSARRGAVPLPQSGGRPARRVTHCAADRSRAAAGALAARASDDATASTCARRGGQARRRPRPPGRAVASARPGTPRPPTRAARAPPRFSRQRRQAVAAL
jgi:hypothetical protein